MSSINILLIIFNTLRWDAVLAAKTAIIATPDLSTPQIKIPNPKEKPQPTPEKIRKKVVLSICSRIIEIEKVKRTVKIT